VKLPGQRPASKGSQGRGKPPRAPRAEASLQGLQGQRPASKGSKGRGQPPRAPRAEASLQGLQGQRPAWATSLPAAALHSASAAALHARTRASSARTCRTCAAPAQRRSAARRACSAPPACCRGGAPSSCAGIVRTKKSESNARSARGRGGVRASFSTASPEESRPRKTPAAASSAPAAAGQSGRGV
jgi:hypothetical protein